MDIAARYGGDEFVLLLPKAQTSEAAGVVQRIREEYFSASAALLNRPEGVRMSVGIGSVRESQSASADQLIAAADKALYDAKGAGRDRIAIAEARQPVAPNAAA